MRLYELVMVVVVVWRGTLGAADPWHESLPDCGQLGHDEIPKGRPET